MGKNHIYKISVIIPAYNVENYIYDTINSCLAQTFDDIEIIVVNDGSTDNTLEIINSLSAKDNRIKVISQENEGVTSARENGLKVASADYIFFLDGDDQVTEDTFAILYDKAIKEDADFIAGDFNIVYPNGKKFLREFPYYNTHNSQEALKYAFRYNDFYYTGRLIKRHLVNSIFNKIPRDITYGEDTYAVVNILSNITRAAKVSAPILNYIQRDSSVTNKLLEKDLIKRNKATSLTLKKKKKNGIISFAENDVRIFALRELVQSIKLGCPNINIIEEIRLKRCQAFFKSNIGIPLADRIILLLSIINIDLISSIIQRIKRFR